MAIETIERRSELWQLKINDSKSSFLRLGKRPLDHDQNIVYSIAGHLLLQRESVTDLGIENDPNLKFSAHIVNITSRAFRRLGVLCKAFTLRDLIFTKRAYTTYVRPVLEYCTQIWSPTLIKYIDLIGMFRGRSLEEFRFWKICPIPKAWQISILNPSNCEDWGLIYWCITKLFEDFYSMCDDFLKFSINPYPTRGNHLKLVMPIVRNNNSLV